MREFKIAMGLKFGRYGYKGRVRATWEEGQGHMTTMVKVTCPGAPGHLQPGPESLSTVHTHRTQGTHDLCLTSIQQNPGSRKKNVKISLSGHHVW